MRIEQMTGKERFYATIERKPVDHPASWLGFPVEGAERMLLKFFGVSNIMKLKMCLNDDIWPMEVPFNHPPANHIACAFDFAKNSSDYEERTLTAPGFFADCSDLKPVEDFPWPNPKEHMSSEACASAFAGLPEDKATMGMMWSAHFQDACAAFGMETAMMKMLIEPDMFRAVIDRITEFYLEANQIFYEAGRGKLDAVLIGNDFGSQTGLMLSPDLLREFVFPGTSKLIEQAKSYGLKVIHHSCGSIAEIIPDLIELGADAIHPIQVLAKGMDPKELKEKYGDKVSFCGGVDVQQLLVHGSPDDVRNKVMELKNLFPTGLIISPSHEAVLPDVAPENIKVLFDTLKEPK